MKNLVFILAGLLVGSNSFARGVLTFECYEYQKTKPYRHYLYLTYTGDINSGRYGDINEGEEYVFKAQLFFATARKPGLDTKVIVEKEDVMIKFKNKKGAKRKINGIIYLDEMEASWMELDGNDFHFNCRIKKFESKH